MRSAFFLALSAATLLSCADKQASSVVIALSSEAPVPTGVSSIHIQVQRGGQSFYDQVFTTSAVSASVDEKHELTVKDIPGTLTLRDDGNAKGPVTVTVTATMNAHHDGTLRTARRVGRAQFVNEKQRLLRMPIQFACAALGNACTSEQSCRAGQCVSNDQVDSLDSQLEDASEAEVVPVAGRCFSKDPLTSAASVAVIPVEQLVGAFSMTSTGTCTVPGLFPSIAADASVLADLRAVATTPGLAPSSDLLARLNQLRAQTNMGYIWSGDYNPDNQGVKLAEAKWTVVDRDPHEGWCFDDDSASGADDLNDRNDLTMPQLVAIITTLRTNFTATLADPDALTSAIQQQPALRVSLSAGLCQVLQHDLQAVAFNAQNPASKQTTFLLGTLEQRGAPSKDRTQPACASAAP